MFICKICGNEVKAGQAFCPTCGADVVDNYQTVCPVCGAKNGAGSKYCAKCGGILSVMRKPVCTVCGSKNLPGAQFCVSCGAPLIVERETHSDADLLNARKAKMRVDSMEKDRLAAADREIAAKREKAEEERAHALAEVEQYREKCEADYNEKLETLEEYRAKINEFGAEDVALLKKMSAALKDYSRYYADPYSQIDEDDIEDQTYVCPACGNINPLGVTRCINCGRDKARAMLLLAKKRINQSPPVKRRIKIIAPPEEDLKEEKLPPFEEFAEARNNVAPPEPEQTEPEKKEQADFSGPPTGPFYGYPYPPFGYPYPPFAVPQARLGTGDAAAKDDNMQMQMPPIVQPVAFVPYVTQEQPLMQYSPAMADDRRPMKQPVQRPSDKK